jgi:translation initiation factor IF-3
MESLRGTYLGIAAFRSIRRCGCAIALAGRRHDGEGLNIGLRPYDRGRRDMPKKPGGFRVNEEIRIRQVRLVDADGEMIGIVPTEDALGRARDAALDLVEVSPNAQPPVCKILDFGKFKYEQKKRDHEAKRKQRGGDFKEIRFRPKTDKHDLEIKMNKVRHFLKQGDRVQVTMVFRGREMQHVSVAGEALNNVAKMLEDVAKVERPYSREGRRAFIGLMPKPGVKKESKPEKKEPKSGSSRKKAKGEEKPTDEPKPEAPQEEKKDAPPEGA